MDMLEQIKNIREAIQKMSDDELLDLISEVNPESAKRFAKLERWILGNSGDLKQVEKEHLQAVARMEHSIFVGWEDKKK
jgi:hypothetical protein